MLLCHRYRYTPEQVLGLTFDEVSWLMRDPEELDKELRYKAMDHKTRETADFIKEVYGTF